MSIINPSVTIAPTVVTEIVQAPNQVKIVIKVIDPITNTLIDKELASNVRRIKIGRLPYKCPHPLHTPNKSGFAHVYEEDCTDLDGHFYSGYEQDLETKIYTLFIRLCNDCYQWEIDKDLIAT